MMAKKIFTTHDVAEHCRVDITTVIRWADEGSLKSYKTKGGHRRITREDLIQFLARHNMPISFEKRILIVDDDEIVRVAFKDLFESEGFLVYLASDGFIAGTIVEAKRPDVVLMDLIMPGIDGIQVCKHIRGMDGTKHIKIILLTGYPSEDNFEKAIAAGVDKCLAKPVDNDDLLSEIKKITEIISNK